MNRMQFGEGACEKTRKYLDSYVSNELLVETNHDMLRHLESCPACAVELAARTQLRSRLKAAVKAQSVPPGLQARIREQTRTGRQGGWFGSGWGRWGLALAAGVSACAAVWLSIAPERMPAIGDRAGQGVYIQKVSHRLAAVLKVGLGDHIHCTVFRKYPRNPPPVEKMEADLGPAYRGLLPVVRAAVPSGYRVIMAHQCSYAGRKYVHLTFEKGGELLSLVIARRDAGETMEGLVPAEEVGAIPIYQAGAERYQVAAFEAGEFLAYVVSDLKGKANLEVASTLAGGVRAFLLKAAA